MTENETGFRLPADIRLRPPARRYIGIWVGVVTVAVAAAVFFCEMHLTAVPVEQTVMTAAVMILCCFIMYTSLFDSGHRKATDGDGYRKCSEAYGAARDAVCPQDGIEGLDAFCRRFTEEELHHARKQILSDAGEGEAEFEKWYRGETGRREYRAMPSRRRRAFRHAAALRPLSLSAAILLRQKGDGGRRQAVVSVRTCRVKRTVTALVPTVLGSLITVAVTLESTALTAATVVAGILRLFTIVWTGVRGYIAGGYAVTEDDCAALESKTLLLRMYLTRMAETE